MGNRKLSKRISQLAQHIEIIQVGGEPEDDQYSGGANRGYNLVFLEADETKSPTARYTHRARKIPDTPPESDPDPVAVGEQRNQNTSDPASPIRSTVTSGQVLAQYNGCCRKREG